MANIRPALKILFKLEFNNPKNALHKNEGEEGLTYKGIYQLANPDWEGWSFVEQEIKDADGDIRRASELLYEDEFIDIVTRDLYWEKYWNPAKLDKLTSQHIANEIFIFGVNTGMETAIKKAQALVDVKADGLIGPVTIAAINAFNEHEFDYKFDELEREHYADLIARKPSFARFKNGWMNRAKAV